MIRELYSKEEVISRVEQLGKEIAEFYAGSDLTVIVLLNGGMFFGADLIRNIDMQLTVDSLALASYENQSSKGIATLRSQLKHSIAGRHVLVVDDIIDTGVSIKSTLEYLAELKPASVRTCVMLKKITPLRSADIDVNWYGFEIPDKFVVGYGLDYNEMYRNLHYIGVVEDDGSRK